MRLGAIVLRIRSKNTHFGEYVGGAVELDTAIKNTLKKDIAFVLPLIDDAGRNEYDTTYNHRIIERFGVVVALANDSSQADKLGFAAYDQLHDIRGQLISALCGWVPVDSQTQVMYRGGKLIDINNAYLWYQFEFEYDSRIISTATGQVIVEETTFDDTEDPTDFNTIYMQMINTPDARIPHLDEFGNDGEMPLPDGFPNVNLLDNKVMSNWIDLTANPDAGAFTGAFASGFDVDYD